VTIKTIDIKSTSATLQAAVSTLKAGDEILLAEDGKPVARVVPVEAPKPRRKAGLFPSALVMSEDFDDELPEDFLIGKDE
jgi:antitoxin (DNA-binding transcriptional repressor) of toxin-antitoxin stability system